MYPPDEVLRVAVGSIEIAYETFGDRADPPIVLVAGVGAQLLSWPERFCRELVDRGHFVVRFDNRDVGLSTHLGNAPRPDLAAGRWDPSTASYTLREMAVDVAGLIDGSGLGSAHIVGKSMGGMIAQTLVIEHPQRVRSLTSIMSTTGDEMVGQATEAAMALLLAPPVTTREEAMDRAILNNRGVGSPLYATEESELRDRAARAFDRAFDPPGVARQLMAIHASPDRTARLAEVRVPTLVLHGAADPLIQVSGGRATADAIPGAELVVIEGMGHDLPRGLWPEIADRLAALIARAERQWQRPAR